MRYVLYDEYGDRIFPELSFESEDEAVVWINTTDLWEAMDKEAELKGWHRTRVEAEAAAEGGVVRKVEPQRVDLYPDFDSGPIEMDTPPIVDARIRKFASELIGVANMRNTIPSDMVLLAPLAEELVTAVTKGEHVQLTPTRVSQLGKEGASPALKLLARQLEEDGATWVLFDSGAIMYDFLPDHSDEWLPKESGG